MFVICSLYELRLQTIVPTKAIDAFQAVIMEIK